MVKVSTHLWILLLLSIVHAAICRAPQKGPRKRSSRLLTSDSKKRCDHGSDKDTCDRKTSHHTSSSYKKVNHAEKSKEHSTIEHNHLNIKSESAAKKGEEFNDFQVDDGTEGDEGILDEVAVQSFEGNTFIEEDNTETSQAMLDLTNKNPDSFATFATYQTTETSENEQSDESDENNQGLQRVDDKAGSKPSISNKSKKSKEKPKLIRIKTRPLKKEKPKGIAENHKLIKFILKLKHNSQVETPQLYLEKEGEEKKKEYGDKEDEKSEEDSDSDDYSDISSQEDDDQSLERGPRFRRRRHHLKHFINLA